VTGAEFVSADGVRLEAQRIAVPNARGTFVLLHEALGSISHWRDFPGQLASRTGMNVVVYSRQGHGQSEGQAAARSRGHYERQAYAVLPAILDAFGVRDPILLGHSEGAAIALLYAAKNSGGVRALVLESPILIAEPAAAAGMAMAECAWQQTDLRERLARHHRDPDAVFYAWLSIRTSDSLLQAPLRHHMPALRCPVLMLQGGRDEYATGLQAEALRGVAEMELCAFPDAGHTPHREQPQAVLEAIAGFVARLPPPPYP